MLQHRFAAIAIAKFKFTAGQGLLRQLLAAGVLECFASAVAARFADTANAQVEAFVGQGLLWQLLAAGFVKCCASVVFARCRHSYCQN